jgi:hypothetical protein
MAEIRECPKCGTNISDFKYHRECVMGKDKHGYSNQEHLHYFCKCGYDFCILIDNMGV